MTKTITFNELRDIKDRLPDGTTHRIADELGITVETVRNYFGGHNYKEGKSCGLHIEPGPNGGIVVLSDTSILDRALEILQEEAANNEKRTSIAEEA
ncbi:MAG: DNA-binding protein [Tannerella sp.]|nr:DNA-binding protein [Tannerella sp.]